MKTYSHIFRLLGLFFLIIFAYQVAKYFLVPKSYGELGRYRADAVEEEKAKPLRHAGREACIVCHDHIAKTWGRAKHKTVSCESCHGPSQAHTENPIDVKPLKPSEETVRAFCGRCHSTNVTRPKSFPQKDLRTHNPGLSCTLCHPPHKPEVP